MKDNLASIVSRAELGKHHHPYLPSYDYQGEYIDATHVQIAASAPQQALLHYAGIEGFLRVADALKLYELAFFAAGDVLELGTHQGLSAAIIATAIRSSANPHRLLHTVDVSHTSVQIAQAHHKRLGLLNNEESIRYHVERSDSALARFVSTGQRFGFVFVDHDHSFDATRELFNTLEAVLLPSAFVLFHDYNDSRNTDPCDEEYGVFDAVAEHAPPAITACGTFGCCGLFQLRQLIDSPSTPLS